MSVFFSNPRSCLPSCGPRPNCGGGKWNGVQAQLAWHGNEPFNSTVTCGGCVYGGSKYLSKQVYVKIDYSIATVAWVWTNLGGVPYHWYLSSGSEAYHATSDNTTTINRRSGCRTPSGSIDPGVWPDPAGTVGSYDSTGIDFGDPRGLPYYCTPSGGGVDPILITPLDNWGTLGYVCGAYTGVFDGCGNTFFPGGSEADLIANFPSLTVVVDAVTAKHIGFVASQDLSSSGPGSAGTPPDGDGVPGQIVNVSLEYHVRLEVKIDLDTEYSYADFRDEAYALLGNYNLRTTPWKDWPTCSSGMWLAGPSSTAMPLLTYNSYGCCSAGNADLGFVCDPTLDGSVVRGYVRGTDDSPALLRWGGWEQFKDDAITVQKWALRQGSFKPYGYQDGNPKTWRYLLQEWTADLCSADATYTCPDSPGTFGGAGFVICISPNGDFPNTAGVSATTWTGIAEGERTEGNIWQSIAKDATADTYVNAETPCAASPANDPLVLVEPESCGCICPDAPTCGPPGLGACMGGEPISNWP